MLQVLEARVAFDGVAAVDGIDLSVADGEVVALLGPSGSGKTTLLRTVAGLQRLDGGCILWNGEDLAGVPPHRRAFGLVFQDFALFPHLDVGRNVGFGLKMQRVPEPEREAAVAEALAQVELAGFERRSIGTLSGGQQQRVALARSLAARPRMLLLDEPLGSLDRAMRERLADDLRRVLSGPGITALYVTHDQTEAFTVADRVAIIDGGRIVQRGTPEQVWRSPASEFVAGFLGFQTIVDAVARSGIADAGRLGSIPLPPGTADGPVRLVVRPDAVSIDPDGHLEAAVTAVAFRGNHYRVRLDVGGVPAEAHATVPPSAGETVRATIDPGGVVVLAG
jgi:thiamine transport system ATP-binding protein